MNETENQKQHELDCERGLGDTTGSGGQARGETSPRDGIRGGVTPAGYHRGQNPNEEHRGSTQATEIIPSHILGEIIDSGAESGVVAVDEIGLDGITLTGRGGGYDEACHLLADHGFIIVPRDNGVRWYRQAFDIEGGGVVAWEHRNSTDSWVVELPGAQWMRVHEQCRVASFALTTMLQMRCTRIDIRRDQFGKDLTLLDSIYEGCQAGQLCRARDFELMEKHPARIPEKTKARGLYLGSRKSERFVRVYDKGLERGWLLPGWWERYESESRKELADLTWQAIVAAEKNWAEVAYDHLIAVVDFRIPSERHATIEERERPAWWNAFCGDSTGIRPSSIRDETDAAQFLRWVHSCVMPTIQSVGDRLGFKRKSDVWALLEDEFTAVDAGGSELAVRGLVEMLSVNQENKQCAASSCGKIACRS